MHDDLPSSTHRRHLLVGGAGALAAARLATWTQSTQAQTPAQPPAGTSPAAAASAVASASTPASVPVAVAPAGPKPLPADLRWKDPGSLIVHSATTIETRRSVAGASVVTPAVHLYIRNNLPAPDARIVAEPNAWLLSVEGVKRPKSLTVADLKAMGEESLPMVLQCSGNGRGFFPSKPSGTPWQVGAAGCVIWRGVPVRKVVAALGGVLKDRLFMTGTGGELLPAGVDPKSVLVERSVPLAAMADAMLAWEMNGAPIPLAHGGPLRLIVPGYTGVNHIKYVKQLAFTAVESDARIMSHGYRISPPGGKGDPSQPSVQEMSVKSWIHSPGAQAHDKPLAAGPKQILGVAFGGLHPVQGVEVSVDGGATWAAARWTGPDLGPYAWRQFALDVTLAPGTHVLASRATDVKGTAQPRDRVENAGGYNNTSWLDHAVRVTVA